MKQQIITYSIIVVISIVVGLLLYPVLFGDTEPSIVQVAPDSIFVSSEPDTIWAESEVIYTPKYVYSDTGSTRIVTDTVYIAEEREVIVSYKLFNPSQYIKSEVWAKGPAAAFTLENAIVVDWQDHYNFNYLPQINAELSTAKRTNLLKGLAAGGIFAAGLMSGDWRIATGATVAAGGIVIIF